MLNILNLICIYLNFAFYLSNFLFTKLLEAYVFFNSVVDVMPVIFCSVFYYSLFGKLL
ncbi:photosystem II protein K [Populus alba x Populus x berolinensis]|uniref:Photosystem II protein K n=1 Tax=Populus alba x Populus x berolinensis TaxID=444605 RepID=A0AAD6L960_9ROSI|nr:photosystem II protein K [Populus alba x Populus x berolinensis]